MRTRALRRALLALTLSVLLGVVPRRGDGQALFTPVSPGRGGTPPASPTTTCVGASNCGLDVNIVGGSTGGGGGGGTSSTFDAAFPTSGTAAGFTDGATMQGARVFDAATGTGAEYVLGCMLRTSSTTGSVELGTTTTPLQIQSNGLNLCAATQMPAALTASGNLKVAVVETTTTRPVNLAQYAGAAAGATNPVHVNLRDAAGNEVSVGGGTQYAEDTAAASGEQLTMAGVVRQDAAASLVNADGDRTELSVDGSGRLWVNGSGVTQPVSGSLTVTQGTAGNLNAMVTGSVTVAALPANASINVAQYAGASANATNAVHVQPGAGATFVVTQGTAANLNATVTGSVTVASGTVQLAAGTAAVGTMVLGTGTAVAGTMVAGAGTALMGGVKIIDTGGSTQATVKAASTIAATTDTSLVVLTNPLANPVCTSYAAISQTATGQLVAGVTSQKIYVCSIIVVAATTETVNLVEGSGTTCGTSTAAILGSTTAANGMALAAGGGFVVTAASPWLQTATAQNALCLSQAGSVRVSGGITYKQQ